MAPNMTRRTLRISFLSFILALLTMVLMAVSVSAQATIPHQGRVFIPADVLPQSEIVGSPAHYMPNSLSCKVGKAFIISNHTHATQTVIFNGTPQITIAPGGDFKEMCSKRGTFIYGLESNHHAKLTVIVHRRG